MESIRKWFYKPKRDDPSLLAQFFYADEALNLVAAELDSFDGRKDPERCTALVNHLRQCQDKVLTICNRIMDDIIPTERANRDFRVKFPDDVMQENLAGQLWFGAECLAAGSSIMNREGESSAMRPLAKALTKALENVRNLLREQCLRGNTGTNSLKPSIINGANEIFGERLQEALKIFDRLFAEFELSYVSAMVPVKTTKEYELQQLVVVLFSETLQRALKMKLLTQEMVDDYDPALMFTIPRLAIVSGLLIFPDGPLCLDRTPADMSEMFRPFRTLLHKIRELLWTLNKQELFTLEKLLCSSEEPGDYHAQGQQLNICDMSNCVSTTNAASSYPTVPDLDDFVTRFYIDYPSCKQFVTDFYASAASRSDGTQDMEEIHEDSSQKQVGENIVDKAMGDEVVPSWEISHEGTEESEDETEWVGETSECETVVTDAYNEIDEHGSSVESDSKTLMSLPEDPVPASTEPNLKESMVFGEHINPEEEAEWHSSSPCTSYLSIQGQGNLLLESQTFTTRLRVGSTDSQSSESYNSLPISDNVVIPPSNSGFLLANQVGHETMLAAIERMATSRAADLSPGTGESLPDGDSREALSVATATLSTLLLSSPNLSPGEDFRENDVEEDSSVQSCLDSGVGTVVSCSDTGSFSDRSPDVSSAPNEVKIDTVPLSSVGESHNAQQKWEVETIACNCTLSNEKTSKTVNNYLGNFRLDAKVGSDNAGHSNCSCQNIAVDRTCETMVSEICDRSLSTVELCQDSALLDELRNLSGEDQVTQDPCRTSNSSCIKHSTSTSKKEPKFSSSQTQSVHRSCDIENSGSSIRECVMSEDPESTDIVSHERELPSIVVKVEARTEEEWVNMRNGDSQHSQFETTDHLLNYAGSCWEQLRYNGVGEVLQRTLENGRMRGRRRNQQPSSNTVISPSVMQQSGSSVPSQNGRNLEVPLGSSYSSTSSSCQSSVTVSSDSCSMSSDTSSFNSECQDDEEIALAMQAAEIANRNEVRAKFRSSEDLVHRLFVCIAGVADQLQTNFAGDLRHILKCVFLMSATNSSNSEEEDSDESPPITESVEEETVSPIEGNENDHSRFVESAEEALISGWESPSSPAEVESPPAWIPDDMAPRCMSCEAVFTVVRRRHHCRNCGKVFCARCSSNSVPLPRYGHVKPVRVCNRCFLYQVTPFTLEELATRS